MDLKEGWEKKALIGVGVVVLIIIIYAYFIPFTGTPDEIVPTQTGPVQTVPVPFSQPTANNTTANNSTNLNTTSEIQKIVETAYPNANVGTPVYQNSININGTIYSAWEVPVTSGNTTFKVYVDYSGRIVKIV